MTTEERIETAVTLFREGYNCAQSVVAAFSDHYGIPRETGLRMAAGFGAGIGRMRLTCGTACGMFMLAGLEHGATEGHDRAAKARTYEAVQQMAARFENECGSMVCAELLGLRGGKHTETRPEERTPEYYASRPCLRMIATAVRIFAEHLGSIAEKQEDRS